MAINEEAMHRRRLHRRPTGKLALHTAIVHLCCSVACIIIGIFSLTIIKSKTIEYVHGLPLWIGLLLLLTGFSGILCHVKKTKSYAAIYLVLSFIAMFANLISIAWLLSSMEYSEAAVIAVVCVSTFDMGTSCLSSALGCHILFTDCKRQPRNTHSPIQLSEDTQLAVGLSVSVSQDANDTGESVHISTMPSGQVKYTRQYPVRPGDEPPSYTEAVNGPPPAYSDHP